MKKASTRLIAGLIMVAYIGIFLRVLVNHDNDPLAFVLLTPADAAPDQTTNIGYDGRFVYHIAVNDFGDTTGLDEPIFRYQRILYPLLVKGLSFGNTDLVPWIMLLVNLAAAAVSAGLLGELLHRKGVSLWWGLVPLFSLGYLIAMRFDLLEPLAFALVLAALLAVERERYPLAALWLALGALAKEPTLVAAAALTVHALWSRRWWRAGLFALSALPYLVWSLTLANQFGVPQAAVEKSRLFLIPFAGFFTIEDAVSWWVVGLWVVFPAIGFGLWALRDLVRARADADHFLAPLLVLAYAGLIAVLPAITWIDPLAVLRWGLGFLFMLVLWLAAEHQRALPYAAALWAPSGLILALVPGIF